MVERSSVNPTQSFTDYRVGIDAPGEYKVLLTSDEARFAGHSRIDLNGRYFTTPMEWNGRRNFLQVYAPARTVLVLGL
ncbi:1,4-alpha-glucan-branching enzyme [Kwoniella shandongensis]|uniref:1,4-alpha-glucan-branching enzyme n=1 Tax=Kwoniella shandongensis TaxID=1734106 RepID=A0AAJ8MVR5_9TREE